LAIEASEQGVSVIGVFPNHEDDLELVAKHAGVMRFTFPVVRDAHAYLAQRLGATMTPQAVVCDGEGILRYRGAIDDNRYENRVTQRYLHEALLAIRDHQPLPNAETKSLGCSIHRTNAAELAEVTYTQHIARIVQDNCQSCHRPGQVAPFSLTNYDEVKTWATEVNAYTQSRLMPPWKAAPGYGKFKHVRRVSEEQLELIDRWVKGGTLEGPQADMPPNPTFNDQWALGEPDLVLEMPEEYTIAPEGEDDYRHFIIPTSFDKSMFVKATDVIPGNRKTVHHVIAFVDTSGKARELDAADPGPGYTRFGDVGFEPVSGLGGWAPGSEPATTPVGTGFWLPPGADIVLQVHYYRTGIEEKDRTKVGLYFSEHPNPVAMEMGIAINPKFMIPAGANRHKVEACWAVEKPVYAVSVAPHMHLLGKEMKVMATLPCGRVEQLIWIQDWDFNWQGSYEFETPMLFPAGTKVDVVAYFDNSADNPNNPNSPPKPVGWGEKTTDEMCIAFVAHVDASKWQPPSSPTNVVVVSP
jgi:mono/diheme cytochrome c family protein